MIKPSQFVINNEPNTLMFCLVVHIFIVKYHKQTKIHNKLSPACAEWLQFGVEWSSILADLEFDEVGYYGKIISTISYVFKSKMG